MRTPRCVWVVEFGLRGGGWGILMGGKIFPTRSECRIEINGWKKTAYKFRCAKYVMSRYVEGANDVR